MGEQAKADEEEEECVDTGELHVDCGCKASCAVGGCEKEGGTGCSEDGWLPGALSLYCFEA